MNQRKGSLANEALHTESERLARELVLRHGWNSTSYQLTNPGFQHWFSSTADALVGYVQCAGVRVVAGAPVCQYQHLTDVAAEFEEHTRLNGASACYFSVEPRWLELVGDRAQAVQVGAQPVWRAADWAATFDSRSSLRAQANRARNKGVMVQPADVAGLIASAEGSAELQRVRQRWLHQHGLEPLGFLTGTDLLPTGRDAVSTRGHLNDRRLFVASYTTPETRAVAYLVASPIPMRKGWLIEQVAREPDAPNGTAELLIDTAVRALAAEGAERVTLGLSPLCRQTPVSQGPWWTTLAFAWAHAHGRRFYNFAGLEAFKDKFKPHFWEPIHLVAGGPRLSPRELYAVAGAFTGRKPVRALLQGVRRAMIAC